MFNLQACLAVVTITLAGTVASAQSITLQPKPGDPVANLTAGELSAFTAGKQQFDRIFQVADGLGPIFNQNSCASCHSNPVGGSGTILVERFGYLDPKSGVFDPLASLGGSLRQSQSISAACQEIIPPVANVVANRVTNSILGAGLVEAIPDTEITGNAAVTLSRGRVVWQNDQLSTERGTGKYVNRPPFAFYWDAQKKRNALAAHTAVDRG